MAGINSSNTLNGQNPLAYIGTSASGPYAPASLMLSPRDPNSGPGSKQYLWRWWNRGG